MRDTAAMESIVKRQCRTTRHPGHPCYATLFQKFDKELCSADRFHFPSYIRGLWLAELFSPLAEAAGID
jgi:hypothetical protein